MEGSSGAKITDADLNTALANAMSGTNIPGSANEAVEVKPEPDGLVETPGVGDDDQIDFEKTQGRSPFTAVVEASVSRMRPVAMAAITTILGMIPLITDAFFVSMAVTIMFGLAFATALTLIVVPTFYAIFFGVKYQDV